MPQSSTRESARIRRRASARFRNFLIASGLVILSAVAAACYVALHPTTIRIVVDRMEASHIRIAEKMAATFKEQKFPIQLVLILADDEAAVRRALTRGEADVAFARSLQKFEQARAVAILRKNYLVIWKAPDQKSNRRIRNLQEFSGHKVALIGDFKWADGVVRQALEAAGLSVHTMQFVPMEDPVEKDISGFIGFTPLQNRALIAAIAQTTAGLNESPFLSLDLADAISAKWPLFASEEIPAGTFRNAPIWPAEKIDALAVNEYVMAAKSSSQDVIAALTRYLFDTRSDLLREFPGELDLLAPSMDRDAAVPAHPGAAAFVEGSERTFLERYSDYIWAFVLLLSTLGSIGAWLKSFLKKDQRANNAALRAKLIRMGARVRSANSGNEIDRMAAEAELILSDALHSYEDGAIDQGELTIFQMVMARFHFAALQRRSQLHSGHIIEFAPEVDSVERNVL